MVQDAYNNMVTLSRQPAFRQETVEYLTAHLRSVVKPGDPVLICFDTHEPDNISGLMEQAVTACGGSPVLWGEDHRWKTLLKLAFSTRATAIIGTPLVILGLSKLKKANGIPLPIRSVVTAGYPCLPWMQDGITKGFDCQVWECFCPKGSGIVAGFSCGHSRGVHLREDAYTVEVVDEQGRPLPAGELGRWVLSPKAEPELRWCSGNFASLASEPCGCGQGETRLVDIQPVEMEDKVIGEFAQYLLSWTSVLDFSLRRGPYGLELEMIIFPGEQLPKLPSCARQVIRPWDPEKDEPIPYTPDRKNITNFQDSH